jgi:hypothetical protein
MPTACAWRRRIVSMPSATIAHGSRPERGGREMIGVVVFNVLMVLLGLGVASPVVPAKLLSDMLGYLHTMIGITTPAPDKVRMVVLIWVASMIIIVDGLLLLLVLLTSISG